MSQAKKRRSCPAVNRDITAAECGENRVSHYACPESCPFNPFAAANYAALLQAENALDLTCMKRCAAEDAAVTTTIAAARRLNEGHGWHAAIAWNLFFQRDGSGKTFGERWQEAGFPGLKNDERVLFRGKMQLRVALLEVHRVLDEQRFEAVDLLDPTATPMMLVDRSVAAVAVRFVTILTWTYPLPYFSRLSGMGITMSDLGPFSPVEMLDACIAHLGGPAGRDAQRRWLAENFVRINDALVATGLERRRQMLARMDASFGAATYELRASFRNCRSALTEDPAIEVDEVQEAELKKGFAEAMVWFEAKPAGGMASMPGRRVLGRVVLGLNEWRVEAIGGSRLDELRERFEARLGNRVRFVKERRDNLAGQLAAKEPPANLALVPPQLLELPGMLDMATSRIAAPPAGVSFEEYKAEMMVAQRRAWFDEPLPALDGRTAREAAKLPALRLRLLELVKGQVRQVDRSNLETGRADDINAVIRELGLAEIDFPPPPPRRPAADAAPSDDESDDEGAGDRDYCPPPTSRRHPPGAAAGGSAPPFSNRPLTLDEAVDRLRTGVDAFETAADAIAEIAAAGSTLFEDAHALAEGLMDERDFSYLSVFLIQIWFALVPRGGSAPRLRLAAMKAAIARDEGRIGPGGSASMGAMRRIFEDSPQPHLLQVVTGAVVNSVETGPKAARPQPGSVVGIVLVLKAMIGEIDHGLRRR